MAFEVRFGVGRRHRGPNVYVFLVKHNVCCIPAAQFVKSDLSLRPLLVTSLVCSSIMPLGVAIGIVMTETGSEDNAIAIANGILQAIAMGTFIYVTFFEILQEEIDPDDTSLGKICFIAAGFALMALLDLIPEEQGGVSGVGGLLRGGVGLNGSEDGTANGTLR